MGIEMDDYAATVRLLSVPEVLALLPVNRTTLWRMCRSNEPGRFPAPVKIGKRRIAFFENEVRDWLTTQPRTRS